MEQSKTITVEFKYYNTPYVYWLSRDNYIEKVRIIDGFIDGESPCYKCMASSYGKKYERTIMEDELYPTYDECFNAAMDRYSELIKRNPEEEP